MKPSEIIFFAIVYTSVFNNELVSTTPLSYSSPITYDGSCTCTNSNVGNGYASVVNCQCTCDSRADSESELGAESRVNSHQVDLQNSEDDDDETEVRTKIGPGCECSSIYGVHVRPQCGCGLGYVSIVGDGSKAELSDDSSNTVHKYNNERYIAKNVAEDNLINDKVVVLQNSEDNER